MDFNENTNPSSSKENSMDKNEYFLNQNQINIVNNSFPQYIPNSNQLNLQNGEKEIDIEELDGTDNLRFKDDIQNNQHFFLQQRLDSYDSIPHYKYSIDIPNVSKQRLHEYLNDDLLNALDVSPNIPNKNNGNPNYKKVSLSNENDDKNNNLLGFSLFPQNYTNNHFVQNNNNNNLYNLIDFNNNNNLNSNINSFNNIFQKNNNIIINNDNLNNNLNNPQIINKDINVIKIQEGDNQQMNLYQQKEKQNLIKNKFDKGNKKANKNFKKEGKNRKLFEVRAGDWTCCKCNNLNFSFRSKCNRCGISKELNIKIESMNKQMFNLNTNPQLMNNINSQSIYMKNMNINNFK